MEQASLTSLMSAFARVRHAQRCHQPVFDDSCARALLTDEEYDALCDHVAKGAPFLAPDLAAADLPQGRLVDALVARHFAPTPVFRSCIAERELAKTMREERVSQYVILGGRPGYVRLSKSAGFRAERIRGRPPVDTTRQAPTNRTHGMERAGLPPFRGSRLERAFLGSHPRASGLRPRAEELRQLAGRHVLSRTSSR